MIEFVPIAAIAPAAVEQLLDRAFGADRHLRTAYRIRAGMVSIPALSFAGMSDGALVGTIQCWPIRFEGDDGSDVAMVQLGPVAVEPMRQQGGVGRALTAHALAAAEAEAAGLADAITLIGDPEYYGRFFGFDASRTAAWRVPGPVERHRLLARGMGVPDGAGMLGPRVAALA
jgi:predicted N-acetyltransferase YhbS